MAQHNADLPLLGLAVPAHIGEDGGMPDQIAAGRRGIPTKAVAFGVLEESVPDGTDAASGSRHKMIESSCPMAVLSSSGRHSSTASRAEISLSFAEQR